MVCMCWGADLFRAVSKCLHIYKKKKKRRSMALQQMILIVTIFNFLNKILLTVTLMFLNKVR